MRQSTARLVRVYSVLVLMGSIGALFAAHGHPISGTSWSTCRTGSHTGQCYAAIHVFEAPVVLFTGYVGWYGLRRFGASTMRRFALMAATTGVLYTALPVFELSLITDASRTSAPAWEVNLLLGVVAVTMFGIAFSVAVVFRLLGEDGTGPP